MGLLFAIAMLNLFLVSIVLGAETLRISILSILVLIGTGVTLVVAHSSTQLWVTSASSAVAGKSVHLPDGHTRGNADGRIWLAASKPAPLERTVFLPIDLKCPSYGTGNLEVTHQNAVGEKVFRKLTYSGFRLITVYNAILSEQGKVTYELREEDLTHGGQVKADTFLAILDFQPYFLAICSSGDAGIARAFEAFLAKNRADLSAARGGTLFDARDPIRDPEKGPVGPFVFFETGIKCPKGRDGVLLEVHENSYGDKYTAETILRKGRVSDRVERLQLEPGQIIELRWGALSGSTVHDFYCKGSQKNRAAYEEYLRKNRADLKAGEGDALHRARNPAY